MLTFALIGRAGGQGVAIVTIFAAVTEEAVRVVDALQTFSVLTVAVANSVGVSVTIALAGPAGSDRPVLTQGVPEEPIIAELTALPCTHVSSQMLKSRFDAYFT